MKRSAREMETDPVCWHDVVAVVDPEPASIAQQHGPVEGVVIDRRSSKFPR